MKEKRCANIVQNRTDQINRYL